MNLGRALLTVSAGRRSKWAILVIWLLLAGLAGPLTGKLQGVEKTDQVSFLPRSADSTQVIGLQKRFEGSGVTPAVIIYRRASGLTPADRARVVADGRAIRG